VLPLQGECWSNQMNGLSLWEHSRGEVYGFGRLKVLPLRGIEGETKGLPYLLSVQHYIARLGFDSIRGDETRSDEPDYMSFLLLTHDNVSCPVPFVSSNNSCGL